MIISARYEVTEVVYEDLRMEYHSSGHYEIFKGNKKITSGKYDAVIAKSYNEMPQEKRNSNLKMDLESWQKKAIEHKVVP